MLPCLFVKGSPFDRHDATLSQGRRAVVEFVQLSVEAADEGAARVDADLEVLDLFG